MKTLGNPLYFLAWKSVMALMDSFFLKLNAPKIFLLGPLCWIANLMVLLVITRAITLVMRLLQLSILISIEA